MKKYVLIATLLTFTAGLATAALYPGYNIPIIYANLNDSSVYAARLLVYGDSVNASGIDRCLETDYGGYPQTYGYTLWYDGSQVYSYNDGCNGTNVIETMCGKNIAISTPSGGAIAHNYVLAASIDCAQLPGFSTCNIYNYQGYCA